MEQPQLSVPPSPPGGTRSSRHFLSEELSVESTHADPAFPRQMQLQEISTLIMIINPRPPPDNRKSTAIRHTTDDCDSSLPRLRFFTPSARGPRRGAGGRPGGPERWE